MKILYCKERKIFDLPKGVFMNEEIRGKLKDIDSRLLHMWRYL